MPFCKPVLFLAWLGLALGAGAATTQADGIGLLTGLSQLVSDSLAAESNVEAVIGVMTALTQLTTQPGATTAAAGLATEALDALMQGTTTCWLRAVKAAARVAW